MEIKKNRPTLLTILIYAMGQYGWSLASFGATSLMVYFYMPAEDGIDRFPPYIYQGAIAGLLTIIGILGLVGRLLDGFTDPWIAQLSDQMKLDGIGKRKKLMAIAIIPFALSAFLLFFPIIDATSIYNILWLIFISIIYYISFTAYLIPYNALLAELGHHPDDRMKISSIVSITWILGFATGFSIFYFNQLLVDQYYYTYRIAFQTIMGVFALLSLFCMLIPVLFLDEHRYAQQATVVTKQSSLRNAMVLMKSNHNLKVFVITDFLYWLSVTFIQMGVVYYVTILMNKEQAASSVFLGVALLCSLFFYLPINIVVKKWGKKIVVYTAFIIYMVVFALTCMADMFPLDMDILFYGLAFLIAFPMAIFGILPNVIIADIVHEHQLNTGQNQAGLFFAIRTFMMKMGIAFANLLFPSLLLLGKSLTNPLGIRATTIAALLFCTFAILVFRKYVEK